MEIPFFLPSQLPVCPVEEFILVLFGFPLFYCKTPDGVPATSKVQPGLQKMRTNHHVRERQVRNAATPSYLSSSNHHQDLPIPDAGSDGGGVILTLSPIPQGLAGALPICPCTADNPCACTLPHQRRPLRPLTQHQHLLIVDSLTAKWLTSLCCLVLFLFSSRGLASDTALCDGFL